MRVCAYVNVLLNQGAREPDEATPHTGAITRRVWVRGCCVQQREVPATRTQANPTVRRRDLCGLA